MGSRILPEIVDFDRFTVFEPVLQGHDLGHGVFFTIELEPNRLLPLIISFECGCNRPVTANHSS